MDKTLVKVLFDVLMEGLQLDLGKAVDWTKGDLSAFRKGNLVVIRLMWRQELKVFLRDLGFVKVLILSVDFRHSREVSEFLHIN